MVKILLLLSILMISLLAGCERAQTGQNYQQAYEQGRIAGRDEGRDEGMKQGYEKARQPGWSPESNPGRLFLSIAAFAGAAMLVLGLLAAIVGLASRPVGDEPLVPAARAALRTAALLAAILAWLILVISAADDEAIALMHSPAPRDAVCLLLVVAASALVTGAAAWLIGRRADGYRRNWVRAIAVALLGFAAAVIAYLVWMFIFRVPNPMAYIVSYIFIGNGIGVTAWLIGRQFSRAEKARRALAKAEAERLRREEEYRALREREMAERVSRQQEEAEKKRP